MRSWPLFRSIVLPTAIVATTLASAVLTLGAFPPDRLAQAHRATLRLDVQEAHRLLPDATELDPHVNLERALLALYDGECDGAVALLDLVEGQGKNRELEPNNLTHIREVARGCARVTAGTQTHVDEARGVSIRFKDDRDEPLLPALCDIADRGRAVLAHELGVELPRPLRIELVRDHYSLAAMTGLPESAAQTTGTVAVAKWGRVTMLSPRAAPHGYPWADTLMHEMTHLAVTRASEDRAPLWLQEGVAKRQETRWRESSPFDDQPSADALARFGFSHGLALPLGQLGPSIAMLPTAKQATIVFGEVTSFVRYWVNATEPNTLARLLTGLARAEPNAVDQTLTEVSGLDLAAWEKRWRFYLTNLANLTNLTNQAQASGGALNNDPLKPAAENLSPRQRSTLSRQARLGDLLGERGHKRVAVPYLESAAALVPHDASRQVRLAKAYDAIDRRDEADRRVASLTSIYGAHGAYFARYAEARRRQGDDAEARRNFDRAFWLSPWELDVACEETPHNETPSDPIRAALCAAVRRLSSN